MSDQSSGPLRIVCPACGGRVKLPAGARGQRFRCPRCDAELNAAADQASLPPRVPQGGPAAADVDLLDSPPLAASPPAVSLSPPVPLPPAGAPGASPEKRPPAGLGQRRPQTAPASPPPPPEAPPDRGARSRQLDPPPPAEVESEEFGVTCPLCGTYQHARRSQIGKAIRCVDCHTPIPVRAPQLRSHSAHQPPAGVEADGATESDDYQLSAPVERIAVADVHRQILDSAQEQAAAAAGSAEEPQRQPAQPVGDIIAQRAREIFQRAQTEQEQVGREGAEQVVRPLFYGLWSFLADVDALARFTALALMSLGLAVLFRMFFDLMGGGAIQQFGAVFVAMLAGLLALFYVAIASACCLAVIQDTSNGLNKVEQWPGLSFLEWAFEAFYVLNSLFLSAVPGVLLGQVPVLLQLTDQQWPAVLLGTFTALLVFPLMLLSALDAGSPLSVWSSRVFGSFLRNRRRSLQFYLASAGLAAVGLGSLLLLLTPWLLAEALGAAALNLALLVYSRLLGRLAGLLSEDLVASEDSSDDSGQATA